MTKFAPVGPAALLKSIREAWGNELLGRFHLLLAHDVVIDPEKWEGVFPNQSTIIVDNSVIELGTTVDVDLIVRACNIIQALEQDHRVIAVLPEKLDDAVVTHEMSMSALWNSRPDLPNDLMYVIQGETASELRDAFRFARAAIREGVNWIGIPRRITDNLGTRALALFQAQTLKMEFAGANEDIHVYIHLFGFSDNVVDDVFCCRQWGVEGIDSAVPLRMGLEGHYFDMMRRGVQDQAGPRGDFWERYSKPPVEVTTSLHRNLNHVRLCISTGPGDISHTYTPKLIKAEKG